MTNHKVLTTEEMKILDEYTCKKKEISSLKLMEKAGKKIYEHILKTCNLTNNDRITVVSGLGNNGGDSLVVARHLIDEFDHVSVIIIGNPNHLSQETREIKKKLTDLSVDVFYLKDESKLQSFEKIIDQSTFIIDGIFGIGLNRDIEGITCRVIEKINHSGAQVFSVDIPSGINGNNGKIAKIAVEADFTTIIQNYKIGNLLNDAKDYHGKYTILDVGILQDKMTSNRYFLTSDHAMNLLLKRKNNSHKYDFGSVLTIGGSFGMTGAPIMCAYAALRTGAGLSTIAIDEKYISRVNNLYPEIIINHYRDLDGLLGMFSKKNVIAFGPGLGRLDDLNYKILNKLLETNLPLVIDADGLYYLKHILNTLENGNKIVVTPHIGEMARLLETTPLIIQENPLAAIKHLTDKYGITVVLKGPCTIIANDKEVYFSNQGNPGMATAGSGDVLTGIIASFIGQGIDIINACKLAVVIHSSSGDLAKEIYGEYSLIATDIINNIPAAIKKLLN